MIELSGNREDTGEEKDRPVRLLLLCREWKKTDSITLSLLPPPYNVGV
jgi:hypothetical protein